MAAALIIHVQTASVAWVSRCLPTVCSNIKGLLPIRLRVKQSAIPAIVVSRSSLTTSASDTSACCCAPCPPFLRLLLRVLPAYSCACSEYATHMHEQAPHATTHRKIYHRTFSSRSSVPRAFTSGPCRCQIPHVHECYGIRSRAAYRERCSVRERRSARRRRVT
ncbi:hypothetical protein EXIGLDRAFT_503825 [Exidia glandulosa HHB12029]|uniref:Uncharacterized protein n=1 Tax=Exidia glandulosa HHB12029 TaxID=1314781 RepID=A0A166N639_EXIGL|nr:hypothetical protein EXIGLDRAFT_503825 [Exidia glandulosa HHB12029]